MNTSSSHLQFASLVEMAENRHAKVSTETSTHLAACAECAAQLSRLQQVIGLMRTDTAEDAPHNAFARAVNLFHERAGLKPQRQSAERAGESLLRRIVAALSFDSNSAAHAFGVRSGQATARQLLYEAGEHEIDLRVAPAGGDLWAVSGQVLGECRGGEVELEDAEGKRVAATLNNLCEFTLPAVATGRYTLRLRFGGAEIKIEELELRA